MYGIILVTLTLSKQNATQDELSDPDKLFNERRRRKGQCKGCLAKGYIWR